VLVVRAWVGIDGEDVETRITSTLGSDSPTTETVTVTGIEPVCDAIRSWLEELASEPVQSSDA